MTPEDKRIAIIGAPVDGRTASEIPGTRALACEHCAGPTWFAPSSLERPEAASAIFICWPCAVKLAEQETGFEVGPLTEAQHAELQKACRR
jgi:hypothetical protein